jgi:signal transduction histidine kinase
VDGGDRIVDANAHVPRLLGLPSVAVVGKRFRDLVEPRRPSRTPRSAKVVRNPGLPATVAIKRADESLADILVQDIPRMAPGLSIRILKDATGRASLTAALERKTRLLEEAERVGRMGVWEVDLDAGLMMRTPELCRIMEVPIANHTTTLEASYDGYTEASRAIVREAFAATLAHGTPYDLEVEVVTGKGRRMWTREVCRTTMNRGRLTSVIGLTQDITERRQLRDLIGTIANRERARIGADLHDGLGQELTGLALMIRSVARRSDSAGPSLTLELDELADLASKTVATARGLAHGMLPVDLGDGGFAGALRRLARATGATFGVTVSFRFDGDSRYAPDGTVADNLYRIAQEAITNAVKHGRPKGVAVSSQFSETQTILTITNDGQRIEPSHVADGMGMQIMHYRARTLGGLLQIQPMSRGGTRVRCVVPRQRIS